MKNLKFVLTIPSLSKKRREAIIERIEFLKQKKEAFYLDANEFLMDFYAER